MVAQERIEYHWIENRVVPRVLVRPAHVKQWRFNRSERTLIATIEEQERSLFLEKGPAHSPAREVDAIRLHRDLLVDDSLSDYSASMPTIVRDDLRTKLNEALASLPRQWASFAEETDMTGHLKAELQKVKVDLAGWRINVRAWTYKRYPKENLIGADMGVIFDVIRGDQRIIKAIWYQAKIDKGLPLEDVEDLAEQTVKMWDLTEEAYILLYSPDQILAMRAFDRRDSQSLSDNLIEGAVCVRGDRNPRLVANTADIKHVVTFFISANAA